MTRPKIGPPVLDLPLDLGAPGGAAPLVDATYGSGLGSMSG